MKILRGVKSSRATNKGKIPWGWKQRKSPKHYTSAPNWHFWLPNLLHVTEYYKGPQDSTICAPVAESCGYENKHSVPINGREFNAQLNNYQFIKRTVPHVSQSVARSRAPRIFCLRVHVPARARTFVRVALSSSATAWSISIIIIII
jgi:hypothetical protein